MNRSLIMSSLRPLLFSSQYLSPVEQNYTRYYGIDSESLKFSSRQSLGVFCSGEYRIACHYYYPVKPRQPKGTFFFGPWLL